MHVYRSDVYVFGVVLSLAVIVGIAITPRHTSVALLKHTVVTVEPSATLIFVGDMFFDRTVRQVMDEKGGDYLFSCIDDDLQNADMVVGNLEGPITTENSVSLGTPIGSPDNYVFTFPTSTAPLLLAHNIRVVTIGNNHINNFGRSGIESTRMFLEQAGVGSFGGMTGDEPVYRIDAHGTPLSFVSYNEFGGMSPDKVSTIVSAERDAGRVVVVYAHWGDEYSTNVERLRPVAEKFVRMGAKLVVGSHPHVILPHETIDGVPVYYSLGNFIFDQYLNDAVRTGLSIRVLFSGHDVSVEERLVHLNTNRTTCLQ